VTQGAHLYAHGIHKQRKCGIDRNHQQSLRDGVSDVAATVPAMNDKLEVLASPYRSTPYTSPSRTRFRSDSNATLVEPSPRYAIRAEHTSSASDAPSSDSSRSSSISSTSTARTSISGSPLAGQPKHSVGDSTVESKWSGTPAGLSALEELAVPQKFPALFTDKQKMMVRNLNDVLGGAERVVSWFPWVWNAHSTIIAR
jgi:hypothetical protein